MLKLAKHISARTHCLPFRTPDGAINFKLCRFCVPFGCAKLLCILRAHLNVFANLQDRLVTLKYPLLILNDFIQIYSITCWVHVHRFGTF